MKATREYLPSGIYKIRILLGALFAAVVADGIITMYLFHSGIAKEGNPFMVHWVVEDKLLSIKILGGSLAVIYLWNVFRRHPRLSIAFSSILLMGYLFIISWNLMILV